MFVYQLSLRALECFVTYQAVEVLLRVSIDSLQQVLKYPTSHLFSDGVILEYGRDAPQGQALKNRNELARATLGPKLTVRVCARVTYSVCVCVCASDND